MKLRNVIFYVKDIEKAKAFYKKIGFEIDQGSDSFVSYKTDTENIWFSINSRLSPSRVPGRQTCCFWVNNVDEHYKKMKTLKVKIHTEPFDAPFGRVFIINDIDGNKIEFIEK